MGLFTSWTLLVCVLSVTNTGQSDELDPLKVLAEYLGDKIDENKETSLTATDTLVQLSINLTNWLRTEHEKLKQEIIDDSHNDANTVIANQYRIINLLIQHHRENQVAYANIDRSMYKVEQELMSINRTLADDKVLAQTRYRALSQSLTNLDSRLTQILPMLTGLCGRP